MHFWDLSFIACECEEEGREGGRKRDGGREGGREGERGREIER